MPVMTSSGCPYDSSSPIVYAQPVPGGPSTPATLQPTRSMSRSVRRSSSSGVPPSQRKHMPPSWRGAVTASPREGHPAPTRRRARPVCGRSLVNGTTQRPQTQPPCTLWTLRAGRRRLSDHSGQRGSVGPVAGVVAEVAGEAADLGGDEDLDEDVAGEPGELRELAEAARRALPT